MKEVAFLQLVSSRGGIRTPGVYLQSQCSSPLCFTASTTPRLSRSCPPHSGEPPGSRSQGIMQGPTNQLLLSLLQGISVSPEPCVLPETPPLLSRPACQRLQPQTQWGCWSHNAEVLPSSEDQGPGPAFQLGDQSPSQSSGLQLSGCPELWQEDLGGAHLGVFYR